MTQFIQVVAQCFHSCASQHKRVFVETLLVDIHPGDSLSAPIHGTFTTTPLQLVFGIGHRLPADLTNDDVYASDPVYNLAATDASSDKSRQIREAAMRAHAEVSISDRIEDMFCGRPRTQTVLRADDVIMVWKTKTLRRSVVGGWDQACAW